MKRSFLLLLALPVLNACGIEDDYAMNDYRYPPPQVSMETPYYAPPRYEGSGNYHGHQSAYRRYHGHYGNNNPVIVQTPRNNRLLNRGNVHGHYSQTQPAGNRHGHPSQNQAANTHGHPDQNVAQAPIGGTVYGHENQPVIPPVNSNQGNNVHGHD